MSKTHPERCQICGVTDSLLPASGVHGPLARQIRKGHSNWDSRGDICRNCLLIERTAFAMARLEADRGTLDAIEADVARKAASHVAIADVIDEDFARNATFGDRAADTVARHGGSWAFVIAMVTLFTIWILINVAFGVSRAFDPYPFILLNLALSCIAAFQAPILLMASNRASARDRAQADQDYRVNLKAELEIASLHDKLDHLLHVQWDRMVELQELQLELLAEIRARGEGSTPPALPLLDGR